MELNIDRIDFISAYCDRWCERCAFTSRCSAYAVQVATAMCDGDFEAAMELAIGAPPPESRAEAARREEVLADFVDHEPTEQEMVQYAREEEARDERVDESPVTTSASMLALLARHWLEANRDQVLQDADPEVVGAIEVAGWDAWFIHAKLHRALSGRDEHLRGDDVVDDPVQNDWNGSAKVALTSIARSTAAWRVLAEGTADPAAAEVVEELTRLRVLVEHTFPDAWKFIRPGFDQAPP